MTAVYEFKSFAAEVATLYDGIVETGDPSALERYIAQGTNYYVFGSHVDDVVLKLPLVALSLDDARQRVCASADALQLAAGGDYLEQLIAYSDEEQPALATRRRHGPCLGSLSTPEAAMPSYYYFDVLDTLGYMHRNRLTVAEHDWRKVIVNRGLHFLDLRIVDEPFAHKITNLGRTLATLPRVEAAQRCKTARAFYNVCAYKLPSEITASLADALEAEGV